MNLDGLLERIWQELDLRRVYTKKKARERQLISSFAGSVPRLHGSVCSSTVFQPYFARIVLTCQRGNKTFSIENAVGLLHKCLLA